MAKNGFQTKKLEIAQTKVCVVENADNQATFRADFKWYDAKKTNNVLEKKEFRKLAKAQYDFTESETNRLMKKFDTYESGGIDREEYAVRLVSQAWPDRIQIIAAKNACLECIWHVWNRLCSTCMQKRGL